MSEIEGERYEEILSALEKTEEGQRFLSAFLKRHRSDDTSRVTPLKIVDTSEHAQNQSQTSQPNVTSAPEYFANLTSRDGDVQDQKNPVIMAMRELSVNLQRSEINSQKAQQIISELKQLAGLLRKGPYPTEASQIIEYQVGQMEGLEVEKQKAKWQLAKVLKILQILDQYVRQKAVSRSG